MGHTRDDVVATALDVLDRYGLGSLTMRRLGAELAVQPSALYHHVPDKQTLLGLVADEILRRGRRVRGTGAWHRQVVGICIELREAVLAYRDGADVVATALGFGLGADAPGRELAAVLAAAGFADDLVTVGSRTLVHFVLGHAGAEQTALQAAADGAVDRLPAGPGDFDLGLGIVLDGLRVRLPGALDIMPG